MGRYCCHYQGQVFVLQLGYIAEQILGHQRLNVRGKAFGVASAALTPTSQELSTSAMTRCLLTRILNRMVKWKGEIDCAYSLTPWSLGWGPCITADRASSLKICELESTP